MRRARRGPGLGRVLARARGWKRGDNVSDEKVFVPYAEAVKRLPDGDKVYRHDTGRTVGDCFGEWMAMKVEVQG